MSEEGQTEAKKSCSVWWDMHLWLISLKAELRGQSQQGFFSPCGKRWRASLLQWWLHTPIWVTGHADKVEMSQNGISLGNPSLVIFFYVIWEWGFSWWLEFKCDYVDTLITVQRLETVWQSPRRQLASCGDLCMPTAIYNKICKRGIHGWLEESLVLRRNYNGTGQKTVTFRVSFWYGE